MAWANLRGEIAELFSEYSQWEAQSDGPLQLWEQRRALLQARHRAYVATPEQRAKQNKRFKLWKHRRRRAEFEAKEVRQRCKHCRKPFRRKFRKGPPQVYCRPGCSVAAYYRRQKEKNHGKPSGQAPRRSKRAVPGGANRGGA